MAIEHRQEHPSPEIEYSLISIRDENDLGTGRFTTLLKPNVLSTSRAILSVVVNVPVFQISVNTNPDTGEVPVLLGKADGTDPISRKVFLLPANISSVIAHEIVASFKNWQVTGLELDGKLLVKKKPPELQLRHFEISGRGSDRVNPKIFFEAHERILEELFGREWFLEDEKRKSSHPAYKSWKLCTKLIAQNGIVKWPDDAQNLPAMARVILDNYFLLVCSGGDISSLRLGSFANYGDDNVRRRLYSVLGDENGFESLMTELAYSAWHISKGHEVRAYEETGYPDFQVFTEDAILPLVTDCKRIRKDTKDSRFSKIINKANKQIKALGIDCYGVAAIDITEKVTNPNVFSDEIPKSVLHISEVVSAPIREYNSSVSAVLLFWDDYVVHGEPGASPSSLFAYRRRSHVLRHRNPVHELPENVELFDFGNTLTYRIRWPRGTRNSRRKSYEEYNN